MSVFRLAGLRFGVAVRVAAFAFTAHDLSRSLFAIFVDRAVLFPVYALLYIFSPATALWAITALLGHSASYFRQA